jgi:4,5-dihydroxyphthalate decarboxylase
MPIFVSRAFRHSGIYIRTDRGIERPEDLRGRVVGVPEYQVTAAVWIRGILQHEYAVPPKDIRWRSGGVEEPGRHEKLSLDLPDGVELAPIPADDTLGRMLEAGEIDALVAPRAPSCYDRGARHVGRLWPNVREVERAYFAKTGIFPIMHVVGVRRSLVETHPWLPSSLYKAFVRAKRAAQPELTQVAALKVMLPWVAQEAEETIALMGHDFWPYGIEDNRPTLDAILQYHFEQGLSGDRPLALEDLFIRSTMERVKV